MLHRRVVRLLLLFLCLQAVLADENFRCNSCQQISESGYSVNGKFYCELHLEEALPKCHNCQIAIKGNYLAVGPQKKSVCSPCHEGMAPCFLCALPSDQARGGGHLQDGRSACAEHVRTGVTDPAQAKRIFNQARREIHHTFGGKLSLGTAIKDVVLVDLPGLQLASDKGGHSSGRVLGVATVVLVSQGTRSWVEPSTIHLLNYVPEERMLTVSAHEYAHVWHAEKHRNYAQTSPILREGFAEWVAYKVAKKMQRNEQISLMQNPSGGIYYQGLQKLLEMERQRGITGVLNYVTQATTI